MYMSDIETFEFTKHYAVKSDAVDQAWYDERDGTLAVDLHDVIYLYEKVPVNFAETITAVSSVGREWLPALKKTYGPSTDIGYLWELDFVAAEVPVATVGTPKALNEPAQNEHQPYLSLVSETPVGNKTNSYYVHFDVAGVEKQYQIGGVTSVDEAVSEFNNLVDMLGTPDIALKGVFVEFE